MKSNPTNQCVQWFAALGVLGALLTAPAYAECKKATVAPEIPQGATASAADMDKARKAVQAYVNDLQAYQSCMEQQIKSVPERTDPEIKQLWRDRGNAAIDAANRIKDAYIAQSRIYKARQP